MSGKRAHKYINFGCNVTGNEVANNWKTKFKRQFGTEPTEGVDYVWHGDNQYSDLPGVHVVTL